MIGEPAIKVRLPLILLAVFVTSKMLRNGSGPEAINIGWVRVGPEVD
jgi:hypothetical protein